MANQEMPPRAWRTPFRWILLAPLFTVPVTAVLVLATEPNIVHESLNQPEPLSPPSQEFEFNPSVAANGVAEWDYIEKDSFLLLFLLPGMLNLGAFFWVAARTWQVRTAAIIAGLLGFARLLIPVVVLEVGLPNVTDMNSHEYYEFNSEGPFSGLEFVVLGVWMFGFIAWVASLVGMSAFGLLISRGTHHAWGASP